MKNADVKPSKTRRMLKHSSRICLFAISLSAIFFTPSIFAAEWTNEPPTELNIAPTAEGYIASKRTGRLIGSKPALKVCITGELRIGGKLKINPVIVDADEDLIKHDADGRSILPGGTRDSVIWRRVTGDTGTVIQSTDYELVLTAQDFSMGSKIEFEIQPFTETGFPDYNDKILTGSFDPNDIESIRKIWRLSPDGEISTEIANSECAVVDAPIKQPVELTAKITVKNGDEYIPLLQKGKQIPKEYYNDVAVDITKPETLDLPATGGREYFIRFYENDIDVTDIYAIVNPQDSAEFATAKQNFINHIKWQFVYPSGDIADVVFDRTDLSFTTQKTNDDEYWVYQNFDPNQIINGIDNNDKITVSSAINMAQRQQKSVMQIEYDDALLIKAPK